jgi:hypothetical protein
MELNWLNSGLKQKVKEIFEPRYKRNLTDKEVEEIAENLTSYMETIIKFKLRYENKQNIA